MREHVYHLVVLQSQRSEPNLLCSKVVQISVDVRFDLLRCDISDVNRCLYVSVDDVNVIPSTLWAPFSASGGVTNGGEAQGTTPIRYIELTIPDPCPPISPAFRPMAPESGLAWVLCTVYAKPSTEASNISSFQKKGEKKEGGGSS